VSTTAGALRALVAQPLWRRWTLAAFLARLPTTMTLLALVLAGEQATGSIAIGSLLAGVATFTSGFAAPWRGRALDRREIRGGLQRASLAAAAAFTAQGVALAVGAPVALLFVLAFVQGVAFAAISGGFRALLPVVVPREDLARANALEAVFVEVAFVSGPAVAGVVALLTGPVGVLLAMAASVAGAALVARGLPPRHPVGGAAATVPPWRAPGALPVYLLALAMGVTVGMLESAVPARMDELGLVSASAGFLLALVAGGSALGGIVASLRGHGAEHARRRAALLLGAFAVLLAPTALTGSLLALALALFVTGVPIAPLNALGAMVLQDAVPAGRQAEGFSVFIAAIMVGAGAGQALTGAVLGLVGAQGVLLAAAAVPLAAAVVLAIAPRARSRERERVAVRV